MAVFRVERTTDFTVMSNHHLRNKSLTLKAKGLLSQMLALPEDWDYTLAGLANINRESVDAIRTAVKELEAAGYIIRRQCRDDKGKMLGNEYIIYERPHAVSECPPDEDTQEEDGDSCPQPLLDFPITDNPTTEKPLPDNPSSEKPLSENPTQLNTNGLNTDISKKKIKKEKAAGRQRVALTDEQLKEKAIAWITEHAHPACPPEIKNALYKSMMDFYAPRETKGQEPAKTQAGFDGLTRQLQKHSAGSLPLMIDMLDKATVSGWKSVYPINGNGSAAKPPGNKEEVEWL